MILEHDDATVEIIELAEGRRRVVVLPRDERTLISIGELETSYTPDLIQETLAVRGAGWLCDEIARDESPGYVQFSLESGLLSYLGDAEFRNKRILDFGCGSGASTAVLGRMFPSATLVGVEQEPNLLRLAERRREFYGHTQTSFLSSPDPTQLPSDLGRFDFVVMNGVVEHMLPEERKSVLPAVWDVVKPGGVLFVLETPYRYFPYESHTTGLPGIGYLPDRLAFVCARKFSRRGLDHCDREALLRAGIRGSSSREILSCLGSDGGRPVLMEPTPSGGGDRIGLWYQQSSVHRESRLRDISLHAFKALKTLTGIEMVPYLTLAIRKS